MADRSSDYPTAIAELIATYEHPEALVLEPGFSIILGLESNSVGQEIEKIRDLTTATRAAGGTCDWALQENAYGSVAEAHLQRLSFWCVQFLQLSEGSPDSIPAVPAVRELRSRHLSPLLTSGDGLSVVFFPSGFINTLDKFFRAHCTGVAQGKAAEVAERMAVYNSGLLTNHVGGDSIWCAMKDNFESCRSWIHYLIMPMVMNETFEDEILILDDQVLLKMHKELFGLLESPLLSDQLNFDRTPDVSWAVYLTVVFVLFHEIAHQFLPSGAAEENNATDHESRVDALAYAAYYDYVRQESRGLRPKTEHISPVADYVLGPASLFAVGICRYTLGRIYLNLVQHEAPGGQADRLIAARREELGKRRHSLINIIAGFCMQRGIQATEMRDYLLALMEFYVMEMAVKESFKPRSEVSIDALGI